jgi:hypothetical protein
MAKTTDVGQIVTAFPTTTTRAPSGRATWLWGAAEIALADEATGAPAAQLRADLATAARWARAYIAQGHPADGDTLQPVRQRRGRRGRAAAGHAAGRGRPRFSRARRAAQRPGRAAAVARTGPRATRSRSAPSSGPPTPRRTRSACSSPTRCTRSTAAPPVPGVRPAAAELRARRERLGQLVRGRRGNGVPALHAERDRQPGGLAHRQREHPAGRGHRRPEQPGELRRPGHGLRDAGLQRGQFAPFNTKTAAYEDNVVSWPSVEPADDYTADPCWRSPSARLALADVDPHRRSPPRSPRPPCWPSTAATARPTWPWWPSDGTLLASARGPGINAHQTGVDQTDADPGRGGQAGRGAAERRYRTAGRDGSRCTPWPAWPTRTCPKKRRNTPPRSRPRGGRRPSPWSTTRSPSCGPAWPTRPKAALGRRRGLRRGHQLRRRGAGRPGHQVPGPGHDLRRLGRRLRPRSGGPLARGPRGGRPRPGHAADRAT